MRDSQKPLSLPDPPASMADRLALAAAFLLFAVCSAYGVLEVHSSTDTWIGLAGGRDIVESTTGFPKTDRYSFTAQGQTWFNQNWLTHVWQYWLYSRLGPNWVIYGTWAMAASIFGLTLLAAFVRTGHLFGATLVAAVVAVGGRDFLSARPATTGFFLMAVLGLLLAALESHKPRHRWWPIVAALPLLIVWGCAHGSFMFGYGLLGVYVAHNVFLWIVAMHRAALDRAQATALVVVVAAALTLTMKFGPFGIDNFTHGEKIAGSSVFRQVSEWYPPSFVEILPEGMRPAKVVRKFPPMLRFFAILGLCLVAIPIVLAMRLLFRDELPPSRAERGKARVPRQVFPDGWRLTLFDLFVVLVGLIMTFWARRFAPIFLIFAAPVALVLVLRGIHVVGPLVRRTARWSLGALALPAAVLMGWITADLAKAELVDRFKDEPEFNLFERVMRYEMVPYQAMHFLRDNDLQPNLMVEWTQAGIVMFLAPNVKVFMDGRAQQVYDERTYLRYAAVLSNPNPAAAVALGVLDGYDTLGDKVDAQPTNAVLLRRTTMQLQNIWEIIDRRSGGKWALVYFDETGGLFLRRDSDPMRQLLAAFHAGTARYPDSGNALVMQGNLAMMSDPPDLARAAALMRQGLEKDLATALVSFPTLASIYRILNQEPAARETIRFARERLAVPGSLPASARPEVVRSIESWEQQLNSPRRGRGQTQDPATTPSEGPRP
jgi:hypothetical protein